MKAIEGLQHFLSTHLIVRRIVSILWHATGIGVTYALAFGLRFDFALDNTGALEAFQHTLPLAFAVFLSIVLAFKLHAGLWSYFSYGDCLKYIATMALGTLLLGLAIFIQRSLSFSQFPRSVLIIHLLVLLVWEIGGRMGVRFLKETWGGHQARQELAPSGRRTVLVGAPDEADSVLHALGRNRGDLGDVVGLITDARRRGTIRGVEVLGNIEELPTLVSRKRPNNVVILPPNEKPRQIKFIMDACSEAGLSCQYRIVPSVKEIAGGQLSVSALREVRIEDLLDRPEIRFDRQLLTDFVSGKHVMVTGAGGSIGSELCRQALALNPKKLVLFDQCEFALFEIDRELRAMFPNLEIVAITGDICEKADVRHAIRSAGGIDIVYHAAAYKHVHLMELNTAAAMRNNVFGTHTLAEVAEDESVGHFIMISTDKAVNPTSMMGSSKRLAERALLERTSGKTRFLAVRFGNVLGSSGSVIPIFQKQIQEGGPVTVTTKETRRYFMTIPEAVQLVMMSGVVGDDRQIMVLEMGEPIKIWNLAKRMIELSGLVPDRDIQIIFTGLRPGEKEYEELLTNDEDVVLTSYDQIAVFSKRTTTTEPLDLDDLARAIKTYDPTVLRNFCREAIPEHLLDQETSAPAKPEGTTEDQESDTALGGSFCKFAPNT